MYTNRQARVLSTETARTNGSAQTVQTQAFATEKKEIATEISHATVGPTRQSNMGTQTPATWLRVRSLNAAGSYASCVRLLKFLIHHVVGCKGARMLFDDQAMRPETFRQVKTC